MIKNFRGKIMSDDQKNENIFALLNLTNSDM